jgi:hypothetical protein
MPLLKQNYLTPRPSKCQVRKKPLPEDGEDDNVLLGQGYRAPREAVNDERGALVEWYTMNIVWSHLWLNLGLAGRIRRLVAWSVAPSMYVYCYPKSTIF